MSKASKRAKADARKADAPQVAAPAEPGPTPRPAIKIAPEVLSSSRVKPGGSVAATPWTLPTPPPGMVPDGGKTMAMDDDIGSIYGWAGAYGGTGGLAEGLFFPGYPYLAELAQRPEYRRGSEIIAKEMTRKWIKLVASGDGDKSEKLAAIDTEMKRLKVQDTFRRAAEHDGFFGKGQIYLDTGATQDPAELKTALIIDKAKIGVGALKRLVVVEPIWTYPTGFNATDPLSPNYYKPQAWFTMGKEVHTSRWLTFVGREMPDMLKPAYMFGGLSLSQMAKPYVDNWIRTRQSISDLIHSFSVSGLKTNMSAVLSGSIMSGAAGMGLLDRMSLFNNFRDNSGMMLVDKDTEEFWNVSTPLSTLDHLQAQAQEQMASVQGIPLVVLLGITPSGLNASSDGEIAVWNAWIEAQQEHIFSANLSQLLLIIQLSLFGEVDPDISFAWERLGKIDETAAAAIRKSDADVAVAYIACGVIDPTEERARLAGREDSLYPGLELEADTSPPEPDEDDIA